MVTDIEFYLNFCKQDIFFDQRLLVLSTTQSLVAEGLCKSVEFFDLWLMCNGFNKALLYYPECKGKPYEFDGSFARSEPSAPSGLSKVTSQKSVAAITSSGSRKNMGGEQMDNTSGIEMLRPYLRDADEIRVLEFIKEKIADGLIVIITSQTDNRCRFTSKSLKPSRAFWTPAQFNNYDYLKSWDIDRIGAPSEEYYRMRELLDRDDFIPGYKYRLIRPDGALCEYATDYYNVADGWCGDAIRIGLSKPEDWRLLVPAGQ